MQNKRQASCVHEPAACYCLYFLPRTSLYNGVDGLFVCYSFCPHSGQKVLPDGISALQPGHLLFSFVPQWLQNFDPAAICSLQFGQRIIPAATVGPAPFITTFFPEDRIQASIT